MKDCARAANLGRNPPSGENLRATALEQIQENRVSVAAEEANL